MLKSQYIFRPIKGNFYCHDFCGYLLEISDALTYLRLEIDDDCQFCRIIRNGTTYEYRHYNNSKIVLTIYEQDSKN